MMKRGIVLGHHVSIEGIKVDPNKVNIIVKLASPTNQTKVKKNIDNVGYYCRFISYFNKISSPLFALLTKDSEFEWTEACQRAFNEIKEKTISMLVLRIPNWVFPFRIQINSSNEAVCVVLGQQEEGKPMHTI